LRLVRVIWIWWIATFGSTGVFPISLKAMTKVQLPDQLVPWWEWTVVSQEEGRTEQSSCAPTTTYPSQSSTNSWVISSNLFCFTSLEPPFTQSVPWTVINVLSVKTKYLYFTDHVRSGGRHYFSLGIWHTCTCKFYQ
jgi:hypothetical protein